MSSAYENVRFTEIEEHKGRTNICLQIKCRLFMYIRTTLIFVFIGKLFSETNFVFATTTPKRRANWLGCAGRTVFYLLRNSLCFAFIVNYMYENTLFLYSESFMIVFTKIQKKKTFIPAKTCKKFLLTTKAKCKVLLSTKIRWRQKVLLLYNV